MQMPEASEPRLGAEYFIGALAAILALQGQGKFRWTDLVSSGSLDFRAAGVDSLSWMEASATLESLTGQELGEELLSDNEPFGLAVLAHLFFDNVSREETTMRELL